MQDAEINAYDVRQCVIVQKRLRVLLPVWYSYGRCDHRRDQCPFFRRGGWLWIMCWVCSALLGHYSYSASFDYSGDRNLRSDFVMLFITRMSKKTLNTTLNEYREQYDFIAYNKKTLCWPKLRTIHVRCTTRSKVILIHRSLDDMCACFDRLTSNQKVFLLDDDAPPRWWSLGL